MGDDAEEEEVLRSWNILALQFLPLRKSNRGQFGWKTVSFKKKVPVKEHWVSFPCSSCELPGSSAIQLREHRRAFLVALLQLIIRHAGAI